MFREMRRFKQLLPQSTTEEVLNRGTSGVLAVHGDEGYPYAVPVSYAYRDGKIFFHCATAGHKYDAIKANPKVSFCVIDKDQIVEDEYTSYFRSVIAFGTAKILEDEDERWNAMYLIAEKYSPNHTHEHRVERMNKEYNQNTCLVEITVEHVTGKEAIELVRARESK